MPRWKKLLSLVMMLAALAEGVAEAATAPEEEAAHLCVIPVAGAAAEDSARVAAARKAPGLRSRALLEYVTMVPGLPRPLIGQWGGGRPWTVTEKNAYEPFGGDVPRPNFLPETVPVREASSGRLLVAHSNGRHWSLYGMLPGQDPYFLPITAPDGLTAGRALGRIGPLLHVPRLGATLIGTEDNGLWALRGRDVEPLPFPQAARARGDRRGASVHPYFDLPDQRAVVVRTSEGQWALRHDTGASEPLLDLLAGRDDGKSDYLVRAVGLADPRLVLLMSYWGGRWLAEFNPPSDGAGGDAPARLRRVIHLFTGSASSRIRQREIVPARGEYLVHTRERAWHFFPRVLLHRAVPGGLEPVPGAQVIPGEPRFTDLSYRGVVAVATPGAVYLFDERRGSTVAIPDSGQERVGRYRYFYDLPSVGLAVMSSEKGLFELTREPRLEALALPFTADRPGGGWPYLAEMPASRMALVSVQEGMFALDASGSVRAVRGSNPDLLRGGSAFAGVIPERGAMLLQGRGALYLGVDRRLEGSDACASATSSARDAP